tara:strand:- start:28 stop:174 length:147 start_codon:yes stop_codon:yes gene_type:complete
MRVDRAVPLEERADITAVPRVVLDEPNMRGADKRMRSSSSTSDASQHS